MDAPALSAYQRNVQQMALFSQHGPFGLKIDQEEFSPCSWIEKIQNYTSVALAVMRWTNNHHLRRSLNLMEQKIQQINQAHLNLSYDSILVPTFCKTKRIINSWNKQLDQSSNPRFQSLHTWIEQTLQLDWKSLNPHRLRIIYPNILRANPSPLSKDSFCYFTNEERLPLIISPKQNMSWDQFQVWINKHKAELKDLLNSGGAVLLRGFPIHTPEDFASIQKTIFDSPLMDYIGEGSRTKVRQGVYTSTEAPGKYGIELHNELNCTDDYPSYFNLWCQEAPAPGSGQTILGRTQHFTQTLQKQPEVWNAFKDQTIEYISRHPPEGSLFNFINKTHKTWQNSFETDDKERVKEICQTKRFECRWIKDWVEVTRYAPAMIIKNKSQYWFNQFHLYDMNPKHVGGWVNYLLFNLLYFDPHTRPYDVRLKDGPPISRDIVYKIYAASEENTIKFDWQKGDVLFLDNVETLHGRHPYSGKRRILVSFIK